MREEIALLILGMAVATYLTRGIPLFFMNRMKLSPRMERFLQLTPITAVSVLIYPGVLEMDTAYPYIGVAGAVVALVLSLKKRSVVEVVLGSVAVVFLLYWGLGIF